MYTINKDGTMYLKTVDAILALNLFSQLVQSGVKDVTLLYGKRVFASGLTIKPVNNGK